MNWLKQKIDENRTFCRVLALAIGCNLIIIGVFALVSYSIKDITVTVNGQTAQYKTAKSSVDEMLSGWGVTLEEKDVVKPGINAALKDGTDVRIDLYEVSQETVSEETDFKTRTEYTSDLMEGETEVTKEGVKGEDKVTYEIITLGGVEQSRREIGRETVKKPVTEVVAEGTAVSYNGVKYSRVITVVATGYTHTGNRTATGTWPHRGTMAVDRGVVAMGSYGYVPGYGDVHAEDTGGAIRGNRIDLFFNTRGEAVRWGRRTVDLYIK